MAFSTRRGRPRALPPQADRGTSELRAKRSLGITTEPIDLCLARQLITPAQHWCGMHWRWLYTLRYGAPSVTSRYEPGGAHAPSGEEAAPWRIEREREYQVARTLLQQHRRYDSVMRLTIYNELPAFLSPALQQRGWELPALAEKLAASHHMLREGLELLVLHWKQQARNKDAVNTTQPQPN